MNPEQTIRPEDPDSTPSVGPIDTPAQADSCQPPSDFEHLLEHIIGQAFDCKREDGDRDRDRSDTDSGSEREDGDGDRDRSDSDTDSGSESDDSNESGSVVGEEEEDIQYKLNMLGVLVDSHRTLVTAFADLCRN